MAKDKQIAVIGGGSWATALVKILCNNVPTVNWWMRNESSVQHIIEYRHNPRYLQSVEFDRDKLNVSNNLQEILDAADIIVIAIPSAFVADVFEDVPADLMKDKVIVSAVKGIIPEFHSIPARYFHKKFDVDYERIGMISGPCHAEEVGMERLSYLTIACQDQTLAGEIAGLLKCRYISTTTSDDIFGVELAAITKNVYAIASGICSGLGYGDNFQAVLITNAIAEIRSFVDEVSPIERDVNSSAYLGDLLVTAYSRFSRNRSFGFMIGKGYSVKTAQLEMDMIAEGYYAVKSIHEINKKFNVEMPILEAVYNVVYEKISPVIEMKILSEKLT